MSYWSRVQAQRLSRRHALAAAGTTALVAAFVSACGSSSNGGSGTPSAKNDKSGLIYTPVDTTAQAKAGGVIKTVYTAEILHFDALASNTSSVVNDAANFTYPRLLKYSVSPYPKPYAGGVEGDAMQSYEYSPDHLALTFKVRPNTKWDDRAPTSGRAMDAQDVAFSWKKFVAVNANGVNLAYDAQKSPNSPVESVMTPDAGTVVLKLKQPDSALLTMLAGFDQLSIMPRESDGGFDPKTTVRGYGPWLLEDYRPSAYTYWRKNPQYYVKGRPYPDRMERYLIPEYATRLAQFKTGSIYTDVVEASQQDVVQLKKDAPQALLLQGGASASNNYAAAASPLVFFGYEGDSPFKDARMRQALSMSIDRQAYGDAINNRSSFGQQGLDIRLAYNSHLSPAWTDSWLDPTNEKQFGPNAKYLNFNVAEAKKLVAAAGSSSGADFDFVFNKENTFGAAYARTVEIYGSMFADADLKPRLNGVPYATWITYNYVYLPANFNGGGMKGFAGTCLRADRPRYTAVMALFGDLHPQGDGFVGATADGTNAPGGDPKVTDGLASLRRESDAAKIKSGLADMQRYLAQQMYFVPGPTNSVPFTLWWPVLGNVGAFTSSPVGANRWAEQDLSWWIDDSKPPLAKS